LENDYSNNDRHLIPSRNTQQEFQQFLNGFRINNNKFVDGIKSKYYLSNLKENIYNPSKLQSKNSKDKIKKQPSLFKNEQIKFLNNL